MLFRSSITLGITDATVDVHGTGLSVVQQGGRFYVAFTSASYLGLASAYRSGYVFVSSGPLGLLCNRTKIVQLDPAVSAGVSEEALVFIQAVDYQVTYQLTLNGTALTGFTTPKATDANNTLSTEAVADDLTAKLNAVSGFVAETKNSVIYVKRTDGAAFDLSITDGRANTLGRIISKKVPLFSSLPTFAKPG